jgi:hypothetical protein
MVTWDTENPVNDVTPAGTVTTIEGPICGLYATEPDGTVAETTTVTGLAAL